MPVARIDINRIDIAVVASLLIHGLIAILPPLTPKPGEKASAPAPFVARLVQSPAVKAEQVPEKVTEPVVPVAPVVRPRPSVVAKAAPTAPPVERAVPVEKAVTPAPPQFDMLAMINAKREQRKHAENALREEMRGATAPGAADPAMANINRNLSTLNASNSDGTGGVFQILSKGHRTAEFAFNGFRPDTQRRWREVIEVDAGQGGDVERAIVRRMIELIRSHYTGNFTWRSHRLGKAMVMSARPEDGAELEDFLLREFFETPPVAQKR